MSKGAIRVAVCLETSKTIADNKERLDEYYACENTYIFKRDILTVERFDSWSAMHSYFHGEVDHDQLAKQSTVYYFFQSLLRVVEQVCTCEAAAAYKSIDRGASKRTWERLNEKAKCDCGNSLYPLYIIIAENKHRKHYIRQSKDEDWHRSAVPPTMMYIVHPDEREHMERFLAGTDDALYDYVHHLKYDPQNGTEVSKAKEEYESQAKKQKRGE